MLAQTRFVVTLLLITVAQIAGQFAVFTYFAPLLIQVGEAEIILDDSTRVAERAKQAGVQVDLEVWDEMVHVWHVFAKLLPEAQQAIEKVGSYVIAHTS